LAGYRSYRDCELVLVFDAYNVRNTTYRERFEHHGIHVVFTRENETGDNYIEKLTDEIGKNYSVRVVTSDNMIQLTALRSGVLRVSAREFKLEVESVNRDISATIDRLNKKMSGRSGGVKISQKEK
ncbi:MAG: NYN domain-containing protein, partial [Oscillospiraceae bacterium]|nr:NYN domain-containing protein [Oscillospiraceae bacterium]